MSSETIERDVPLCAGLCMWVKREYLPVTPRPLCSCPPLTPVPSAKYRAETGRFLLLGLDMIQEAAGELAGQGEAALMHSLHIYFEVVVNFSLYLFCYPCGTCLCINNPLFLHDSRDCPETAVSLLHQKRIGSGSEPTKEKIKNF